MAAELRWILLGLSLVLLGGIWWWGSRRSGQAAGNSELRESTAGRIPEAAPTHDSHPDDSMVAVSSGAETREWGVSPFEPLSIRTAEYDRVPVLDGPMMVDADPMDMRHFASRGVEREAISEAAFEPDPPADAPAPASARTAAHVATYAAAAAPTPPTLAATPLKAPPVSTAAAAASHNSDRFAAATPPRTPNVAELQRIVTIRVCLVGDGRWSGAQLMAALESHGLSYGRYQVFHRKHVDGRSLFCVASLIEPGTFDIAAMAEEQFRGITLFAVLPGPLEPVDTIDELFATARGLAEELSGMVQDAKGVPLSPQRAAAMREDVARFQALLPQG